MKKSLLPFLLLALALGAFLSWQGARPTAPLGSVPSMAPPLEEQVEQAALDLPKNSASREAVAEECEPIKEVETPQTAAHAKPIKKRTPAKVVVPEEEWVTCSGRVQLVAGGYPVEAQVHFARMGDSAPRVVACDEQGAFALRSPHGRFSLFATAQGCARSERLEFETVAGENRDAVLIELSLGVLLTGELLPNILNRSGRKVLASRVDRYESISATCDEQGRFQFESLVPGSYRVFLDWRSGGGGGRNWVELYANRAEQRVELVRGQPAHVVLGGIVAGQILVSGIVTSAGEPAANFLVYAFTEEDSQPQDIARTGKDGAYQIKLVAPGDVRFTVGDLPLTQVSFERFIPNAPEHSLDFTLPGGVIRGTLTRADGKPLIGQRLLLSAADAPSGARDMGLVRLELATPEGQFEFKNLRPGRFRLRTGGIVGHQPENDQGVQILQAIEVRSDTDVVQLDIDLRPQVILTGRVLNADGDPVEGAQIRVVDSAGWSMLIWGKVLSASDGSYSFPEVGDGKLRVWCEVDGKAGPEASVDLQAGEARQLDLIAPD